jgi:hypothetical protein
MEKGAQTAGVIKQQSTQAATYTYQKSAAAMDYTKKSWVPV